MLRRPRSLQGRLLALVLVLVAAVWAGTAALTWFDAREEIDELLDGHLAQAAALLVAQQVRELGEEHGRGRGGRDDDDDHDRDDRGVDAPALHRYAPPVAFQVFHEGRLALRSANAPAFPMATDPRGLRSGFATVAIDGQDWRVFAARGAERDVQVYVGERADSRAAILRAVLRSTLWPMALALPLLALGAGWAVYRGLAPLRRLGHALAARRAAELQPVTLGDTPAEVAPVLAALNGLFERVRALLDAERRFTADAAHELRTPIAAIRAQAQVALGEADDARRRQALAQTLAGCDRAARLVDQLLTLARLEAAEAPPLQVVDLGALARSVLGDAAPAGIAKGQSLSLDATPQAFVRGDATLLAVLVRNLVDNAVRYSPPGARIEVRVAREDAGVVLSVEDSGPGLSPRDLARLGERFFRVVGSGETGSGLGWSIVRRIAAVHGGALQAQRSTRLGGLAVQAVFPPAPAAGNVALVAEGRAG
jgi:two-component system sensor histidine kinase QseC